MAIQDIQLNQKDAYLSNPNLKKANTTIQWSQEQIIEFLKCKDDPVYFAKTYLKIVSLDYGLVPFNLYPFQEKLIQNFHKHRFNICKMPRQTGKMLSLDTSIPTPTGWTTMGELKIGDIIFGRNGKITKVIGKSPIQKIDTYEIEFDNGEIIKACSQHLWKVSHSDWYHKEKVLNTKEILNKFNNLKKVNKSSSVYININESIDLPEIELPIDPYTLGVWLGDGSRGSGAITGLYEDIEKISEKIPLEITTKSREKNTENVWRYYYKNLRKETHTLGLNKEKIIPEQYLRSSINQRLELLRGLMDTDGSVSPNGACEFYQKDGKLLHQVRELLSSLGIKSRIRYKKISGYSGLYGTISFCTNKYEVFTLPRKLERQNNSLDHHKNKRIYIKDIRKIETEPMQCISVDNEDHLFLCGKTFIPTHNSSTAVAYLLHYAVFNDNVNIAILANKASTARDLLQRLQLAYENLPKWMQQGVLQWNRGSLELENGSKIIAASTSASAVRGGSYNIIFLDEFAFIPNHIADDFFASVYPTISSGKSTKVIIVSTPRGMNHFYRMWHDAERGRNQYVTTDVHWSEVPGRDDKWKEQTIANTSEQQFRVEFETEFLGSVNTLINASKLKTLVYDDPITKNAGLDVYEDPNEDNNYLITVDVARGLGNDFSAFIVFDITTFPYKVVAKYHNNEIKPMLFPSIINEVAEGYNNAWVLIEVNDIGDQVANILHFDLEYDNILMCSMRGRAGQIVGSGFSGKRSQLGVRMTASVKKLGCSNLKLLIEDNKLLISDYDIISELTTFSQRHNSFEAEEGCNDDLAMCIHRDAKIVTEDGIKTIKWIVDKKYFGKVLSLNNDNKFVWSNVIGHSSRPNKNKKWIGIRGKSRNTLICTTDHKVAYIEDIFNPEIKYTEAENMLGKYNVVFPGQRFHKSNPLFNKTQISALVGTLIGDSSISKSGKLVCAHGKSQENYAIHKSNLFNSKLRIKNKNNKITFWIDGLTNEHTRFFRDQLYPDGKKNIKNILNFIDEISLAYWYMDDGSRRGNSLVLCTDSFTYEEHELIVNMLKKKFNIEASISKIFNTNPKTKKKTEAFRISITTKNSDNFFKIISPYIIESMRYKLPEKYHSVKIKQLNNNCLDFGTEKITKIMDRNITGFESKLYDITVENTHNFIANGMIVHNCLVIFSWLVAQDYFKEMTDNDVRKRIYDEQKNQIEQDMAPFGFISNGLDDAEIVIEEKTGEKWILANQENKLETTEIWNLDEYGDRSYMWEYR